MDERRDSQEARSARAGPDVAGAGTDGVDVAVARWQSQLLLLNRSNNLLYFKGNTAPKDPKSGRRASIRCVPINRFNPDGIDDYLQRSRRGRAFDYARRRRRRRSTELQPATNEPVEADDDIEFVRGDLPTDVEPLALQQVLLRFLRKEREWMEEQGINVLFLASGFLEWIDEEREQAKAPLLLLPCDLQRSSPREPFVLRREDDDATANATLRHKLRQFDILLPDFNHESYAAYLDEVSDLISGRDGWRVTYEVVLSTFQYTKLAMWEDLEQMRTVGVTHPLVRRLAGESLMTDASGDAPREEFPPDSELVGGRLDDILDLRQEVAVLPADHSQLRAVAAARGGGNLVIHGPPGTGKSQTIVNIISNLLTHGNRVLFVSEKSVALDVVKDRLDQEELGVFCLDMHSDRASKTSVYEQLHNSLEDICQISESDYGYAELEVSRTTLNDVVRALHKERQPLRRSIYQVQGLYAQVRHLPDVDIPFGDAPSLDESRLREIGSLTERIARRPDQFRDLAATKWRALSVRVDSVGLADQIRRDANSARRAGERAQVFLGEQAELLGVAKPAGLMEASGFPALARHLDQKPLVFEHWLHRGALARLRRVASENRDRQRQTRELAARVECAFGGPSPAADYPKLSRLVWPTLSEIESLQQALGSEWAVRLMPNPSAPLQSSSRAHEDATEFVGSLDDLAARLGTDPNPSSWLESLRMLDSARELVDTGTVPLTWLDREFIRRLKERAADVQRAHEALTSAEADLAVSFDLALADEIDNEALDRFHTVHRGGLQRLIGGASLEGTEAVHTSAVALVDTVKKLASLLGADVSPNSWGETARALDFARDLADDLRDLGLVPKVWLGDDILEGAKRLVQAAGAARAALVNAESDLFEEFDAELVDVVDDELLRRLRVDHQSCIRRLLAGDWRRDQRLIRSYAKIPTSLTVDGALHVVQRALELGKLRDRWAGAYASVEPLLGPYPSGHEIDWIRITNLIDETTHRMIDWPWDHTALRILLSDDKARQALRQLSVRADAEYRDLQSALSSIPQHRLDQESVGPSGVARVTKLANTALTLIGKYTDTSVAVTVNDGLEAVQRAVALRKLRESWNAAYAGVEPDIGQHARSRQTNWAELRAQLERVEGLMLSWPWQQSQLNALLTDRSSLRELDISQQAARKRLQSLDESLQNFNSDHLDYKQIGPAGVAAWANEAIAPLQRLEAATNAVVEHLAVPPVDWLAFTELVDDLARLQCIEDIERASRADLHNDFSDWFDDRDTDWDGVLAALQWCWSLNDLADDKLGNRLRQLVLLPDLPFDPSATAESIESFWSNYSGELMVLDASFDPAASPWTSWELAPFATLLDWLESVHDDADSATNWIEFKMAADGLDRILGDGSVRLIRDATEDAGLISGIVNRRLFSTWLDAASEQNPELSNFTARDHEALRREFEDQDRQLPLDLREETRATLFEKYPKARASVTGYGQLGLLRGALTKRRRQMSVRHLLAAAPQLVQALKPCFLMSPLAVSQYLERTGVASANLQFDTVIFDEASQVLPEDAVPAISRASQTVVVGDRRQLPPTTLFQRRYEHEDDGDGGDDLGGDETDWFEGRESILDVMVGMVGSGVAEHYLGVHYRSRHDSLIRYSNHYFYDNRLLTFPSPRKAAAHGVNGVYLPAGRYEAGGSRTNRMEAEQVVALVFELLRTRPNTESIGVVALSRTQADLIETLIDEAREFQPEYEDRFARERQERFFVKNLENVQGDERDHILLSVGYGPTESGRIYNRFGPINNDGGERRLNVAVSRARRSMTIVHSLKPEDITSESRGARLLKRYLEFARNPDTVLKQDSSVHAEAKTESPFEEVVRRTLAARGHRVDLQVGVSGYRIDLAIQAEDGEGYALGIECDGATYHSAPAARDRDWLRQSVLEGLGWKIHRVWSRAWIQNPERELEAIEQSLNESEALLGDSDDAVDGPEIEDVSEFTRQGRVSVVSDEDLEQYPADDSGKQPGTPELRSGESDRFEPYEVADLSKVRVGRELRHENVSKLCELITEVVRVEGPVHRDVVLERVRRRFRASRMRGATRQRFLSAIRAAAHVSLSWLPEESAGATAQYMFLIDPAASESITPRAPIDGATRRRIEHISLAELKAGILKCADLLYGAGRDDLIAETARQFGYRRTGKDIASRIGKAVDQLIHAGKLTGDAQMLSVAD